MNNHEPVSYFSHEQDIKRYQAAADMAAKMARKSYREGYYELATSFMKDAYEFRQKVRVAQMCAAAVSK